MSRQNKKLAGAVMVSLAIFISWGFVLPIYEHINQLQAGVSEMNGLLESRSGVLGKIDKLKAEYKAEDEDIRKISIIIPAKKNIPELISAIESLATTNGLALSSIDLTDGEKESDLIVNIETNLYGSYGAFKGFLTSIEKNRRLVEINAVKLNLDQTGGLQIQLGGYAHVLTSKNTKTK